MTAQPEDPVSGTGTPADGGSDDAPSEDFGNDAIHFHFPIDIQVIGGADDSLIDRVVERVFAELRSELERRA